MSRCARIALFLIFLGTPTRSQATHALVQNIASTECTGGTTCTISATATGSGHTIIVVYKFSNNATFVSLTNNNSNANTRCGSEFDASGGIATRTGIFYSPNINAGNVTYTITISTAPSDDIRLWMFEYSGLATSATCDQMTGQSGTTSNTNPDNMTSGNVTTTQANELVIGWGLPALGTASAGTGFTSLSTAGGNIVESKDLTATGTLAATATDSNASDTWFMSIATFKDSGGGSTPKMIPLVAMTYAGREEYAWRRDA